MTFPSSLRSPPLPLQRAVRFNNCRRRHAAAVPRRLRFGLSVVRAATTPRRREGEAGGGGREEGRSASEERSRGGVRGRGGQHAVGAGTASANQELERFPSQPMGWRRGRGVAAGGR